MSSFVSPISRPKRTFAACANITVLVQCNRRAFPLTLSPTLSLFINVVWSSRVERIERPKTQYKLATVLGHGVQSMFSKPGTNNDQLYIPSPHLLGTEPHIVPLEAGTVNIHTYQRPNPIQIHDLRSPAPKTPTRARLHGSSSLAGNAGAGSVPRTRYSRQLRRRRRLSRNSTAISEACAQDPKWKSWWSLYALGIGGTSISEQSGANRTGKEQKSVCYPLPPQPPFHLLSYPTLPARPLFFVAVTQPTYHNLPPFSSNTPKQKNPFST